jgi:hypothetical protein
MVGCGGLIVEQYVARVSLAQTVVVLQHGEVVYDSSVADLRDATERLLAPHRFALRRSRSDRTVTAGENRSLTNRM